jgi:endonuclease/exonuclease/phosphatase family metal-dependent hydrolase
VFERPPTGPGKATAFRLPALLTLIGLFVGGSAARTAEAAGHEPQALRVMTYNINHGAGTPCTPDVTLPPIVRPLLPDCSVVKLQLAAQAIREAAPDVVALQEVDRLWTRSGFVDQGLVLATELGMAYCYGPNLVHPPDEHSPIPHEYGNAILSRLPLEGCVNHHLPKVNPDTEQRGLLRASVRYRGEALPVFTHLQHCSPLPANRCGAGNPDRLAQVGAMRDLIGTPDAAVLMGDFNAAPDWPELSPTHERFVDAWAASGDGGPGNTHRAQLVGEPLRRYDHVFVRGLEPGHTIVPQTLVTRLASDHYPVFSESIPPGP